MSMNGAHPQPFHTASRRECRAMCALAVRLLLAVLALACSAETSSEAAPAELVLDTNSLRARVSACLGVDVLSAVSLFGPDVVDGLPEEIIACLEATDDCDDVLECFGWLRDSCAGVDQCESSAALECAKLANDVQVLVWEDCAEDAEGNHTCRVIDDGKSAV